MADFDAFSEFVIEPLSDQHDVSQFSCGESELNRYLKKREPKNTKTGYGRTFVVKKPGHPRVWAFCTLAAGNVDVNEFPDIDDAPKRISVVLLGRFAVHSELQGKGVGQFLMGHVFEMALKTADCIGVYAIVLDAKNERVQQWYQQFGFSFLPETPLRMFLPMSVLRDALGS